MKKKTSLSCSYLHNAIYLAPNELRNCCKRFFHKGKMKGDVKIMSVPDNSEIDVKEIIKNKNDLYEKINQGKETECTGCPYLERKEWPEIDDKHFELKLLSVESTSICSMKCTYCSEMYFGGLKPNYNVDNILNKLNNYIHNRSEFELIWGGGEPLLLEGFDNLIEKYSNLYKPSKNMVYSNALKYSNTLEKLLKQNKASLTTSIDAGTPGMFKKVRGVKGIEKVLSNLKKYSQNSFFKNDLCLNIIIKFIATDENLNTEEISGFLNYIKVYKLHKCSFQLSSDFKYENLSNLQIENILELYFGLKKLGIKMVFFDYHSAPRIKKGLEIMLNNENISNIYLKPFIKKYKSDKVTNVIVWGAGDTGRLIIKNNFLFRKGIFKINHYVDRNKSLVGKKVNGCEVKNISSIRENSNPILIASSAFFDEIYNQIIDLNIDTSRVIDPIFV